MPLPKLDLTPESSHYDATPGPAVLTSEVVGGLSRTRLDQLGAPVLVDVEWLAGIGEFAYLGAFFRSMIEHGSQPFLIDLPIGYSAVAEQQAQFLPGSFQLTGISGLAHTCSASLEVVREPRDAVADMALVNGRAAAIGGLPVMALIPSLDSYSVQRAGTVLRTQPGLGPSAFRLDRPNTASQMQVVWNVGPADYDYLAAFYYTALSEGALPFLITSVHDHPDPRQLKAKIVAGSFSLAAINGMTFSAKAVVEVVPITSPDYDTSVLAAYAALGEDWLLDLGVLERLVNTDMPGWD